MRARLRVRLIAAIGMFVAVCVFLGRALGAGDVHFALTPSSVAASIVIGFVAAFTLSHLVMKWLDDAVRPLTEAAHKMHLGDLTVRARITRAEDVGELGAAFEELAGSLSKTVGELRTERDLVSRILNGMQEGVLLLDGDGRVALMNPALREMLLLRADVVGQPLLESFATPNSSNCSTALGATGPRAQGKSSSAASSPEGFSCVEHSRKG